MKPYVLKDIPKEDLVLFKQIERVIQKMPDIEFENKHGKHKERIPISCHVLCQALAKVFPVRCIDGRFFIPFWRHSWLETKNENIIDAYPWALVGGPILVFKDYCTPWSNLYHEEEISDLEDGELEERVSKTINIIKNTLRKGG